MQLERSGDFAVLRMDAGKGNAIGSAFLDGLTARLDEAEGTRALVITGTGKIFSAGLALPELIDLERDAMRAFMQRFERVMERVLTLPCPTVAAINGHAVAGGCVMALQCDTRIMATGGGKIGLSEVALGVGLPSGVVESLRHAVPGTSLFSIALRGELLVAERAHELGLVDEVAAPDRLDEVAAAAAGRLAAFSPPAYAQIKHELQRPLVAAIREHKAAGLESWLDTWYSDAARAVLRATIEKLGANK